MKCMICHNKFIEDNVYYLYKIVYICHNCSNLFIYDVKNVRIDKAIIKIYYLKYYDNIIYFNKANHFNNYLINHALKNKLSNINKLSNKRIILVYKRNDLNNMIELLKNKICLSKKIKIRMYEII